MSDQPGYIAHIIRVRKVKHEELVLRQRDLLIERVDKDVNLALEFLRLGDIPEAQRILERVAKELEGIE